MPRREKIYCGTKPDLPPGYSRFGIPFECLRKGYGACLYAGKLGTGKDNNKNTIVHFFRSNWLIILILILLIVLFIFFLLRYRV